MNDTVLSIMSRLGSLAALALTLASAGACGGAEEKKAEPKAVEPEPTKAATPAKSVWQPGHDGCIRLGWSGGSAGTGFKYVDASVVAETADQMMYTYEQKGGSLKGEKVGPDELKGTWAQKSSSGTFYLKYEAGTDAATGWWRTDGADNRDILTLDKKCN